MFILKSVIQCAVIIAATCYSPSQCKPNANYNQTSNGSPNYTSLIASGEKQINVTVHDGSVDSGKLDKTSNNREFPSSARYKRNLDSPYHDNFDYNFGYSGIVHADEPELPECILSRSEFYLSWWVNEDGTLKIPTSNRNGNFAGFVDLSLNFHSEDLIFKHVSELKTDNPNDVITFMSIANNELTHLPVETLKLVNVSLQYLSLANNNFNYLFADRDYDFQTWSDFPLMNSLKELDLRNCSLTNLETDLFINLPNLEKLFLSRNMLQKISQETFSHLVRLQHLDLSYNKFESALGYGIPFDPFTVLLSGMLLEELVFANLSSLIFLDLSHTKLKQESVRALSSLGAKVEQLSLCYTEIPLIMPNMFKPTSLKVLDLSGNPSLIPNLTPGCFNGLEQKLEILIWRNSNIKSFTPIKNLRKLRMLGLSNNNINQIHSANFEYFADLEILDLHTNHISNWYERVFEMNTKLKILNLRNNNINLMTPEMMIDFTPVMFLAIGANSFVCDCSLRDFIDRATFNALVYQCGLRRSKRSINMLQDPKYHYDVFLREFHNYFFYFDESYKNIIGGVEINLSGRQMKDTVLVSCDEIQNNSSMTFDFLLLDYNENDYHCIESDGSAKRKVLFNEISSCAAPPYASPTTDYMSTESLELEENEDSEKGREAKEIKPPNILLIVYLCVGIPLTLVIGLWFWKRRDIRYFCAILKNTLILSFDKDDQKALMMKNTRRRKSNINNDNYRFDLFVSYSEKDRDFVLDQLIPNLEKRSEITICLHERDFQVGLSILENIIQCMDQSRCLLLVVSESFLKSNWCAFEMHLAQHRLIETRREQLILVLLQDIPKAKRPRTLSFLMKTKTYIMWPTENKEELRSVFWKRLKKAIILNNWEPERANTKPRHSIV